MKTKINLIVPRFGQMCVDPVNIKQVLLAVGIQTEGRVVRESKVQTVLNEYAHVHKKTDNKAILVATDAKDFASMNKAAADYKDNGNVIILWTGKKPKPHGQDDTPCISLRQIGENRGSITKWDDLCALTQQPEKPQTSILTYMHNLFL